MDLTDQPQLHEWAVVELFGHVKFGALLTLQPLGGTAMLRADIYRQDGDKPVLSKLIGTAAIYSVTFCTEDTARALADHRAPDVVARYELPALTAPAPRPAAAVVVGSVDGGPSQLDDAMIEDGCPYCGCEDEQIEDCACACHSDEDEDYDDDLDDPEDEWEAEEAQAEYDATAVGDPEQRAAVDASTIEF